MPLPAIPLVGAILAAAMPWITRYFLAKGVLVFAGFLGRLGVVIATNELIIQPLIDHVIASWGSMPPQLQCWMSTFGVVTAASILVSSMTLLSAKQLFFARSAQ